MSVPIPLVGKPYQERNLIASAQRCVNLIAELNTDDAAAPVPITYYPTPGSVLHAQTSDARPVRCTYRTTIGTSYVVVGSNVYFLASNRAMAYIGTITDNPTQVRMADNGLALVIVDGARGWAVNMATNAFGQIVDPAFYGASFVVILDTFFVFNRPNTNQFYLSASMADFAMLTGGTAFDPLDIAAKSGNADPIVGIAAVHRELWLVGTLTTEVWIGTGSADFYFQQQQGAFIDHGCAAADSIAQTDVALFWIMQDKQGKGMVVKGVGYDISEISTPAIVKEFTSYELLSDAIGFCFQQQDHTFYCLAFPTANKTWLYELKTGFWSEWAWCDDDGNFNRHRANCAMFANDRNLIGDWETGIIWELDADAYVDGDPTDPTASRSIIRLRSFHHMITSMNRITHKQFIANMQCGTASDDENDHYVSLRWSNDRGKSYGNPVIQDLGAGGETLTVMNWNRLGMARDRVYELSWASPVETALNGAFVDFQEHAS